MKRIIALLLTALICLSVYGCATQETAAPSVPAATGASPSSQPQATASADNRTPLTPGTYTGSANGMNDKVVVEVAVNETQILDIKVISDQETPGIGSALLDLNGNVVLAAGEAPTTLLPTLMIEHQTINVDAVTGATITSYAIRNAVESALAEAGADTAQWKDEIPQTSAVQDASADVIIIGAGGAGLTAAITAAQNGASVILVEKNGTVGGNSLVCGGIYNSPDQQLQAKETMSGSVKSTLEAALAQEPASEEHAALQAKVKAEWDAYKAEGRTNLFDSAAWFALQTWNGGDKLGKLSVIERFAELSVEDLAWLDDVGVQFADVISQGAGALWQRSHSSAMNMGTGFISVYAAAIDKHDGISLHLNMTAESLEVDAAGNVTGVTCKDRADNEIKFSANKGVVLATGGFGANSQMVQEYNTVWDDLSKVPTTNRSSARGEGIVMAREIGADLYCMDQIQLLFLGNMVDGGLTKYPARLVSSINQTVFVDTTGKRFVQEDGRRDQICSAILNLPDQKCYVLESADGSDYKDIHDASWRSADGFTREYLEENGYIVVADTLSELAQKLGMDPAVLEETIAAYNAYADAGEDEEFGRTAFGCKLENGPYVATIRQASIHHTMGGVNIDEQARVLRTDGTIIEGLVAAGEVVGVIHGGNRLGGNAVTEFVVFGKLAADTLTK